MIQHIISNKKRFWIIFAYMLFITTLTAFTTLINYSLIQMLVYFVSIFIGLFVRLIFTVIVFVVIEDKVKDMATLKKKIVRIVSIGLIMIVISPVLTASTVLIDYAVFWVAFGYRKVNEQNEVVELDNEQYNA